MPERHRLRATTVAGIFALLAPTLGPVVGGYLTETHSWQWIFLINVVPGLAVAGLVAAYVRAGAPAPSELRCLDLLGLASFATSLALLELLLNEGPVRHWQGTLVAVTITAFIVSGALGIWPAAQVPEASALFNLVRNLGGAIGIALIDTMVQERASGQAAHLLARLEAGDPITASFVGLSVALFHNRPMGPVSELNRMLITPLIKRAALTQVLNEAWIAPAILFALSLLALPLIVRRDIRSPYLIAGVGHS